MWLDWLAGRAASLDEERDLAFGWGVARELARLDIGQTVLVKERAVLAVEAIEGTDAAIRRAGELCRRGGFSLVKVARPAQDMRFDVPTIGPRTVETLAAAGGRAIGYEAGRTLVLDVEETVRKANALGIALKTGEAWLRWRRSMAASVGGVLLDESRERP